MLTRQTRACHRLAKGMACRRGLDGNNKASRLPRPAPCRLQRSVRNGTCGLLSAFPAIWGSHGILSFPFLPCLPNSSLLHARPAVDCLAASCTRFPSRLGTTTHQLDISINASHTCAGNSLHDRISVSLRTRAATLSGSIHMLPQIRQPPTTAPSYHNIFAA
jgi:hypothetical protein